MKKTIALVLCLLMVVSLAACGGQATADESSASAEQTEIAEPTTEETTQPEESSEPVETEPAFDTSWASNDFEKLIPQPPFDGWSGEKTSEKVYQMETSQANADGSGTYYDTWAAYIQTLKDCGFTVKGDAYNSECTDSNGNRVELRCGDGHAWITIMKAADSSVASDTSFDTSWAGDEYVMRIPEPPFTQFEISGEDHEYQIISTNESEIAELTRQDIIDYCKILQDLGFTIDMQAEEVDEGSDTGYQFEATNADGVYCYIAFMESRQAVYILIQTEDVENEIAENDTTTSDEESGDTILKFSNSELPDLEWTCEEKEEANGNLYLSYEAENAPQDVVEDFVEQLKAAGYTLYEESVDEAWCFWGFSNDATEGSAIIGFSRKHGKCQIDIFGDF